MTIEEKQRFLKSQEYDIGNTGKNKDGIDGIWGIKCKEATKLFQKSQNIAVDGIFGPITIKIAQRLIKNNWKVGPVKFTYVRANGKTEIQYIKEDSYLTKNFKLSEFMMKESTIKKKKLNIDRNIIILYEKVVLAVQAIRDIFGPISIDSGYRNAVYNKAIGGSSISQHIKGKALDIKSKKVKPSTIQEFIRNNYKKLGIGGLESKTKPNCNQYTHMDIRPIKSGKLYEF